MIGRRSGRSRSSRLPARFLMRTVRAELDQHRQPGWPISGLLVCPDTAPYAAGLKNEGLVGDPAD